MVSNLFFFGSLGGNDNKSRPNGKMHSTSRRPSHSERCSGLPRLSWPLSQLRVVLVLLPAVLLSVGE